MPLPSYQELTRFYPANYYSYNTKGAKQKGFFTKVREKILEVSYSKVVTRDIYFYLALLAKPLFSGLPLKPIGSKRFLDVGCGDGSDLDLMRNYGWQSVGFEIGPADRRGDIHYNNSIINVNFGNVKFDFIRVWHVLEHVPEPNGFLAKINSLLANDGVLVIGIPNTASLYARIFDSYWYNRDIPRHVVNYNVRNLKQLAKQHHFKVTAVKYQAAGGMLGSLQHLLNHKLNKNYRLVDNAILLLLFYPFDLFCNTLKSGDSIALVLKKDESLE